MLGKIIAIGGASASRKNSLAKILEDKGIKEIPVYSTRPVRSPEEINFYLTELEYDDLKNNNKFLLTSKHGTWFYGVLKADVEKGMKHGACIVATPSWIRKLKRFYTDSIISFYLHVDMRYAFIQRLERGDEIKEAYHRQCKDEGMFEGFDEEVDYVLENRGFERISEELADEIMKIMEKE